jgi:HSP20 family molecular chaperone IbpA
MKLINKNVIRELLLTGDIFHTINGGRVQPSTNFERKEDHYQLTVKVPGIDTQNLKVEVQNNQLLVLHIREHQNSAQQAKVPFLIDSLKIPFDVNITGIYANMEEGMLKVVLPFNELANGYRKSIDIYNF